MCIDLHERISLSVACREEIPGFYGKPISPQTGSRWINTGILARDGKRVRLKATKYGRKYVTTRASVREFFDELDRHSNSQLVVSDSTTCAKLMAQGLMSTDSQDEGVGR